MEHVQKSSGFQGQLLKTNTALISKVDLSVDEMKRNRARHNQIVLVSIDTQEIHYCHDSWLIGQQGGCSFVFSD
jgi:hypothetical protein